MSDVRDAIKTAIWCPRGPVHMLQKAGEQRCLGCAFSDAIGLRLFTRAIMSAAIVRQTKVIESHTYFAADRQAREKPEPGYGRAKYGHPDGRGPYDLETIKLVCEWAGYSFRHVGRAEWSAILESEIKDNPFPVGRVLLTPKYADLLLQALLRGVHTQGHLVTAGVLIGTYRSKKALETIAQIRKERQQKLREVR